MPRYVDPGQHDDAGMTAVHMAAEYGHRDTWSCCRGLLSMRRLDFAVILGTANDDDDSDDDNDGNDDDGH